ncbi:MAG: hypothetical protein F6J90_28385 [Moorea sp. SIOASIH]|nr:hypothetical protein [Moorena sp. SIOASIH]
MSSTIIPGQTHLNPRSLTQRCSAVLGRQPGLGGFHRAFRDAEVRPVANLIRRL